MPIQDAHTHFFSRPFFRALAGMSALKEDPEALIAKAAAQAKLQLPDESVAVHRDRWLAEMDRHGVARIVSFASVPPEAETVAEAARGSGGRLIPYTLVNPKDEKGPAFTEKALGTLGMRGLLTFPAMHHFKPNDACMQPILELARKHKAPVIVHCGLLRVKLRDLLGVPRPYDLSYANPLDIIPAANRFRDVTFVVPHFGAGFLRETLMLGLQCENVCIDTSSSNDWLMTQSSTAGEAGRLALATVFRRALDCFGAERILFGTDSSTFPRGWRADIKDTQLAALEQAGAQGAQLESIMGGNLARLLP
ncbi:MAG TPA: amidohydrolase family protein [Candidatus Limnocylindrales bacterium]|nr:amidohydrolase family protein [Candidatus Limnocylindrales bacterium]